MSEPLDGERDQAAPFLPRWVPWLAIPGALGPLLIFGFILLTESAHQSEDCPYQQVDARAVAGGAWVVEEARSCLPDVEERRYLLRREGEARLLGRRRFAASAFEAKAYRWEAKLTDAGEVQVQVFNAGHAPVMFREGTSEEHEKDEGF